MRTSGLFTTHSFCIPAPSSKPIQLVFFGDVHRDAPLHDNEAWKRFIAHCKSLPNPYYIGMGDYLDSTSTSERGMLGITDHMHETFKEDMNKLQEAKVAILAKELKFMRGRLIGLLNGNHYYQFGSAINSDQKLCEALGCQYLGVSTFTRLYFNVTKTNVKSFDMWLHHGAGAGRLLGSSLNRVGQMAEFAEADLYAMGDDHARAVVPGQPRFSLYCHSHGGLSMKTRHPWLLRSGSFLRGYEPGKSSYIVDTARGPRSIGHVELHITPIAHGGYVELDVHGVN